jgi:hypothetical protein
MVLPRRWTGGGPDQRGVSLVADARFTVPLYTLAEAARALGVPPTTFQTWARGYLRRPPGRSVVIGEPVVTSLPAPADSPTVPFIGLAEGVVLARVSID